MKRVLLLAVAAGSVGCASDRGMQADRPPSHIEASTRTPALMGGVIPAGQVATTSTPADVTASPNAYPSFQSAGKFK